MHALLIARAQNYSETGKIVGQVKDFKTFKHFTTEMLWRRASCCCSTWITHAGPQHVSVPPFGCRLPKLASSQLTQCQTPQYNMQLGNIPHLVGSLWRPTGNKVYQQQMKPCTKPCLNRGGRKKYVYIYAQSPDSTAHLLFHFFCNLISTGGSVTTATIDSRFCFRFLSFVVSLVGLLLWFPLKTKLFSLHYVQIEVFLES